MPWRSSAQAGTAFSPATRVLDSGITTLDEIEEVARRLVALRNWGVTDGAKRLGITHVALSRWARRWHIPIRRGHRDGWPAGAAVEAPGSASTR
jgi:hypothetical protein